MSNYDADMSVVLFKRCFVVEHSNHSKVGEISDESMPKEHYQFNNEMSKSAIIGERAAFVIRHRKTNHSQHEAHQKCVQSARNILPVI